MRHRTLRQHLGSPIMTIADLVELVLVVSLVAVRSYTCAAQGVVALWQSHWFTVLRIIFVLGMGLMLVAPLLRRLASPALAGGASIIPVLSAFGLAHLDPRFGQAGIAQLQLNTRLAKKFSD